MDVSKPLLALQTARKPPGARWLRLAALLVALRCLRRLAQRAPGPFQSRPMLLSRPGGTERGEAVDEPRRRKHPLERGSRERSSLVITKIFDFRTTASRGSRQPRGFLAVRCGGLVSVVSRGLSCCFESSPSKQQANDCNHIIQSPKTKTIPLHLPVWSPGTNPSNHQTKPQCSRITI